jgi:hypothetical protein
VFARLAPALLAATALTPSAALAPTNTVNVATNHRLRSIPLANFTRNPRNMIAYSLHFSTNLDSAPWFRRGGGGDDEFDGVAGVDVGVTGASAVARSSCETSPSLPSPSPSRGEEGAASRGGVAPRAGCSSVNVDDDAAATTRRTRRTREDASARTRDGDESDESDDESDARGAETRVRLEDDDDDETTATTTASRREEWSTTRAGRARAATPVAAAPVAMPETCIIAREEREVGTRTRPPLRGLPVTERRELTTDGRVVLSSWPVDRDPTS